MFQAGISTFGRIIESHWSPPPIGWIKFNVDAACKKPQFRTGIGIVGRNDKGQILASTYHDPLNAESLALLEDLYLADRLNLILCN